MNSGPTGSVIVSRTIRDISSRACESSAQPSKLAMVDNWWGWRAPHKAAVTPG